MTYESTLYCAFRWRSKFTLFRIDILPLHFGCYFGVAIANKFQLFKGSCTSELTTLAKKMMQFEVIVLLTVLVTIVNCNEKLPYFEHRGSTLTNNSIIHCANFSEGFNALNCKTDNVNCCNSSLSGSWRDERGMPVHQEADETNCFYVTRGDRVVSLNRKSRNTCAVPTPGLWRCDIPDYTGMSQSLYIYITNGTRFGEFI